MFESILYFLLGFLCSALLALMVSPAIWSRAVMLTKRRIESSVPLTLNEIQADKDQLRAEFAMSTRRLELSIEELEEKAARQIIEINRKRDEMARLTEESREKLQMVQELENTASELRNRLADREEQLSKATDRLMETRAQLEARAMELERVKNELSGARADADARRVEVVAKDTSVANLQDQIDDLKKEITERDEKIALLGHKLERAEGDLNGERDRLSDFESRIATLQKQEKDMAERLQRRDREIASLREASSDRETENGELSRQIIEEKGKTTKAEAKVARMSLDMEAVLSDATNENVKKAIATISTDRKALDKMLKEVTSERDSLLAELEDVRQAGGLDFERERRTHAILRERLNDLAAKVTAMTATLEGEASPINAILSEMKPAAKTAPARKGSKVTAKSKKPSLPSVEEMDSLADRIRALQDTARIRA